MDNVNTERKMRSLDELFGEVQKGNPQNPASVSDDAEGGEIIVELPVSSCIPYHNHKFQIKRSNYEEFVESIRSFGIINPVIVRPYYGNFEIIAGHRRHQGAVDAGLDKIPAIVKDLNDNEAWLIVSETNIQQSSLSDIKHSERAEVLHDYHEALKAQGKRNDIIDEVKNLLESAENRDLDTFGPMGNKLDSRIEAGKKFELSSRTVGRYLRIYYLTAELKEMLDNELIPLRAGVELSYLSEESQIYLADGLNNSNDRLDVKKAEIMRAYDKKGKLNEETIKEILTGGVPNKETKSVNIGFKPMRKIYNKYFDNQQTQKDIENVIDQALALYFNQNRKVGQAE